MTTRRGDPRQGDIWLAALDPARGSEIRKTRPCLGQAALDQMRTVDKQRLVKKLGEASEGTADEVAAVLVEMFTRPSTRG